MASPAPKPPAGTQDEALEILRRLEPTLKDIQTDQRRLGEWLAALKGRVSQLPTLVQIIGSVLAINAGTVAIAVGLVNVLRSP